VIVRLVSGFDTDWFSVPQEVIRPIAQSPGIKVLSAKGAPIFSIHRSMLPLIDTDEAVRILDSIQGNGDWPARDALTQPLGFTLKRTQHQAVDYIRARRGTLLGDEPRVGKTLAAAYSHEPALGKLVVVAPLMVREVWLSWLRRIWPGEEIGIMTGRTFDPKEASKPIVFGHYDILYHWQSGDRIGTLILDEAHALTNPRSRRTLAAMMLASRAARVVAATGTPIWNMPAGLWSVLGLVAPGAFGSYHDFCMRYGAPVPTAYGNQYTGLSNGAELSARLTEIMIRRRWKDVAADIPPITRNTIVVNLTPAQRRKLDMEAERLRDSVKTNTAASLARYRAALSTIKVATTAEKAAEFMALGEPVVVWTWHRDTADKIVERLIADGYQAIGMTGDDSIPRREKLIEQWKGLPNATLVTTMSVAQVGIDLSHSHLTIFAEIDYTPPMIAQAEMRTFAPTRPMNATYIVADHYVDRKIVTALARKLDAASPVDLGTGEGAIASIDAAFRGETEVADMDRFLQDILSS
jgi:superfamily II DNA or RNA helicase